MKLVIHLGVHRTGSTTIQECMKNSRGILKSHGYLYPIISGDNHVKIPWQVMNGQLHAQDIIATINSQKNKLTHTAILSAEDFCLDLPPIFFQELASHYKTEAILYLRDQRMWLESWYNQHIRWPWDRTFSSSTPKKFLERINDFYWIDYQRLLQRIESDYQIKKIRVEVVDPAGTKNTADNFLKSLGINKLWLNSWNNKNDSISCVKLEILRAIDLIDLNNPSREKVLYHLNEMDIPEDDGNKRVFTCSQLEEIKNKYIKSNASVAEKYFKRKQLFTEDAIHLTDYPIQTPNYQELVQRHLPLLLKRIASN